MEKIENELKRQSYYVTKIYNESLNKRKDPYRNRALLYERAKLIGMIEIAQLLKIDTDEFSYIYNI